MIHENLINVKFLIFEIKHKELNMADWNYILKEVRDSRTRKQGADVVCKKYVKKLSDFTGRNTIAYYSGWLYRQKGDHLFISDTDMPGFMNAIHGMDCSRGLDLILHTPGGQATAAEAIIEYLYVKFGNDIRIIVPQLAMSAGTMMACAGKSIVMGKHSSLGPIDPQLVLPNGAGVASAHSIVEDLKSAYDELKKNPMAAPYYRIMLAKYPVAIDKIALDSIGLASELVERWLKGNMLHDRDREVIKNVAAALNEHKKSKDHSRHFGIEKCRDIGLVVEALEGDDRLQDLVLSIHHAITIAMSRVAVEKIIMNQSGMFFAYVSK